MEATIQITGKKAAKVLGAACLATGVVALSAVLASGAAVAAVAEGFRSAKDTVQKIMKKDETAVSDEAVPDNIDKVAVAETADSTNETTAADEVLSEGSNIAEITTEEL